MPTVFYNFLIAKAYFVMGDFAEDGRKYLLCILLYRTIKIIVPGIQTISKATIPTVILKIDTIPEITSPIAPHSHNEPIVDYPQRDYLYSPNLCP